MTQFSSFWKPGGTVQTDISNWLGNVFVADPTNPSNLVYGENVPPPPPPPPGGTVFLNAVGDTVTADPAVAEIFILEFTSGTPGAPSTSNYVPTATGNVNIVGFDPAQDILRFVDTNAPAIPEANFLDAAQGGALIVSDGFADQTTISFNTADPAQPGSQITLVGIQDAQLGLIPGGVAYFEVV